jgi:hypothetical protein
VLMSRLAEMYRFTRERFGNVRYVMEKNCVMKNLVRDTVFARVICALFFLFWPLKNQGA